MEKMHAGSLADLVRMAERLLTTKGTTPQKAQKDKKG